MAAKLLRRVSPRAALGFFACTLIAVNLHAESPETESDESPHELNYTDVAVGKMVDSLAAGKAKPGSWNRTAQEPTRRAIPQASVAGGMLVENPDTSKGAPPFALVDRYGAVLRYVEPVKDINLEPYLGRTVGVGEDTGDVLLASQLDFEAADSDDPNVRRAAFQENIPTPADTDTNITEDDLMPEPDSQFYGEGPGMYYDENSGMDFSCGPECGPSCGGCQTGGPCGPGARGIVYLRAEYLSWWFDGMDIPALVSEADVIGTDPNTNQTIIDLANARDVFGPGSVFDNQRDGVRIAIGLWLDDCGRCAIEGDYLTFGDENYTFRRGTRGDGEPDDVFVFRPYFNAFDVFLNPNDPNTLLIPRGRAFEDVDTDLLDGSVTIDINSEFQSAGLRLRHNLCCVAGCGGSGCGDCVGCGAGVGRGGFPPYAGILGRLRYLLQKGTRRTDLLLGARWARLDESLGITEDLEVIAVGDPLVGTEIFLRDYFATENEFWGGEIGYTTEWEYDRWSLSLLSKLAIGNNRQRIFVDGYTQTTDPGDPPAEPEAGGLLAQTTNIGFDQRDELSVIPELNITLGYKLTHRLRLTAGYTFFYWCNVVRPGDIIDTDVNSTLIPDPLLTQSLVDGDHPRREFVTTDFWAHGLNLGGEYRW